MRSLKMSFAAILEQAKTVHSRMHCLQPSRSPPLAWRAVRRSHPQEGCPVAWADTCPNYACRAPSPILMLKERCERAHDHPGHQTFGLARGTHQDRHTVSGFRWPWTRPNGSSGHNLGDPGLVTLPQPNQFYRIIMKVRWKKRMVMYDVSPLTLVEEKNME